MSSLPATPPRDTTLSRRELYAYGAGSAAGNLTDHALTHLANPVYTIILGVSPAWVGTLLTVTRLWDAFSEPLMGAISDNFRSRWGRRRPFILCGGLIAGLSFIALYWFPRGWSPTHYFVYLAALSFMFYSAHTVMNVPFQSLLPEIAPDTSGRNRLAAVATVFMRAVSVFVVWLFSMTQLPIFTDQMQGIRVMSLFVGMAAIGLACWTFLGVRERHQQRIQNQEKYTLLQGVRETFRLTPVYPLLVADILIGIAGNLVNTLGFFLLVYYCMDGDLTKASIYNGLLGTAFLAASVLAVGPATWAIRRFGRRRAFYGCVGAIVVGSLLKWVCYRENDATWVAVPFLFIGPGVCMATMILTAMKADVTDWDELQSGKRREGMIGAVQSWVSKTVNSLNFAFSGFLLVLSGFNVDLGVHQASGVFALVKTLYCLAPIAFSLLAVLAIRRFSIDETVAAQMRRTLEARRGA
ncbi:MAG: MFS transporter [Opitutaceae bacterium]|nr:MFS transporter [Opitutaceae bacterium]